MTPNPTLEPNYGLVMVLARGIHPSMPRDVLLEDVAQEICLFILEHRWKFNPQRGAFSTWLVACRPTLRDRCMRSLCGARKVRRAGRWETRFIRACANGAYDREADRDSFDTVDAAELLSTLPERTGRVLACRMMDVQLHAIGEELGITQESVRRTEHAGLTQLAHLLGWKGAVGSFGRLRGRGTWRLRDGDRRHRARAGVVR